MAAQRVLIAGCGYVGLALGRTLRAGGHEVFGLRRNPSAAGELEAAGIHPLVGDLADPVSVRSLPSDVDCVIHCAAAGGGDVADYRRVYVEGNRNLVRWLSRHPPRRYVYTSSTGVYGQDDGSEVNETSPTEPASASGRVLVEAEQLLLQAHRERGFPVIVLRLAGIYGPGRGYWLKQFLSGDARWEGDGARVLNMIHRDDVAGAVCCVLEHGPAGAVYNVVDNEPVSQIELFRWLSARLGRALPPAADASAAGARRRATHKRVSNSKLREELGWTLLFPTFREGLASLLPNGN